MANRLPVLPDDTVNDLLTRNPDARELLKARGIDTCCGGSLTLRDAAELRGLALDALLADLGGVAAAPGPGEGLIRRSDTVRAVLARYPATVAVFEGAGLLGCGGQAGPDEPIDLFAAVHRLDADALLARLNDSARAPSPLPVAGPGAGAGTAAAPAPTPELFRPFLRAALWCTLTLGASFGADNLFRIHWATGPVPAAHNWIHAAFQLWGFVLLAIMGVSYHTFPRFLGRELASPRLARATLWLGVAGLLVTSYARFSHYVPWPVGATVLGAALQFAAVAGWAWVLQATARGVAMGSDPFLRQLAVGTLWWLVAAGLLVAGAATAVATGDAAKAARWNEAVYAAALFGGTFAWLQGMLLRTAPMFLGIRPPHLGLARASFLVAQAGAALSVLAGLHVLPSLALTLSEAGLVLVALASLLFAAAIRPFAARGEDHFGRSDPHFATILRLAFAALLLFAVLGGGYGIAGLSGPTPSQFLYDGARHAFGLGFLTLTLFAMAGRIVPIFTGRALASPRLRIWGAWLIVAGLLLRELQIVAAVFGQPELLKVSGVSGFGAALGVILASVSILRTLSRAPEAVAQPGERAEARAVPLAAETNVHALITAHEEAIPILIEAGFTPLANPVLRNTLTRAVSLGQAASMHGIELDGLLARLRAACPHGAAVAAARGPQAGPKDRAVGAETAR